LDVGLTKRTVPSAIAVGTEQFCFDLSKKTQINVATKSTQ
jgi:hypothetical protein